MFSRSFNQKNYSGSNGICGCFSWYDKYASILFWGIVITNDSEIYEKLKIIKYHGVTYNPEIYAYPSFDYTKTSNLFATIALEMFKSAEDRIEKLNKIYQFYYDSIKGTQYKLLPVDIKKGEIPLLIDIYSDDFLAKDIISKLESMIFQHLDIIRLYLIVNTYNLSIQKMQNGLLKERFICHTVQIKFRNY